MSVVSFCSICSFVRFSLVVSSSWTHIGKVGVDMQGWKHIGYSGMTVGDARKENVCAYFRQKAWKSASQSCLGDARKLQMLRYDA